MNIKSMKRPDRIKFISVALISLFVIATVTVEARDWSNRNSRDLRQSFSNNQGFKFNRNQGRNHADRQGNKSIRNIGSGRHLNNFNHWHQPSHRSNYNNAHIYSHNRNNRPVYNYKRRAHRSRVNQYVSLTYAGLNYYFNNGAFYRYNGYNFNLVNNNIGSYIYNLPFGYRTLTIGDYPYYYANRNYYIRDNVRKVYLRVDDPYRVAKASVEIADLSGYQELYVYPNTGQNGEQMNQDKYECHLWAVNQTGFDPSLGKPGNAQDYQRAQGACLEGRGYTVK